MYDGHQVKKVEAGIKGFGRRRGGRMDEERQEARGKTSGILEERQSPIEGGFESWLTMG